uniref:Tudor domain-containing protein 1 n=1 Tax=Ceratitis capitata TaxID=7213 RepID=W8BXP1_CERCA
MAFRADVDRMQTMLLMCRREVELLQANLTKFLLDSEVIIQNDIFKNICKNTNHKTHANVFALLAYDRYMSRVAAVTNLARKFNIHLQLHNVNKILNKDIGYGVGLEPVSCLFEEFVEWHKVLKDNDEFVQYSIRRNQSRRLEENYEENILPTKALLDSNEKVLDKDALQTARKITFAKPESLTIESLPPCVHLRDLSAFIAGYNFSAFITYIDNKEELSFYVCQMHNDMLYELSNMFNLNKSVRVPPSNLIFGISINSKSILRGVLQSPCDETQESTHVLLIDYGELVPLNSNEVQFYDLPKIYRDLPAQAMKCILLGVKNTRNNVKETNKHILSNKLRHYEFKELNFEIIKQIGRVLHVYIIENRQVVNNSPQIKKTDNSAKNPFLNLSEDNIISDSTKPQAAKFGSNNNLRFLLTSRIDEISQNDIICLEVIHISRPNCFYAQILKDKSEQLELFFWNTEEISAEQKLTKSPQVGDLILAQYAKDQFWYRAKVIARVDDDVFQVFYVDYGNSEKVPIHNMAKINDNQNNEPFRAVLCHFADINDITNGNDILFEQAVQMLVVALLNQRVEVKVVQKINDKELSVYLLDKEFAETMQTLVDMGYIEKSEK